MEQTRDTDFVMMAMAFPGLRDATGVNPWNPNQLDIWAAEEADEPGAIVAAQYLLSLWNLPVASGNAERSTRTMPSRSGMPRIAEDFSSWQVATPRRTDDGRPATRAAPGGSAGVIHGARHSPDHHGGRKLGAVCLGGVLLWEDSQRAYSASLPPGRP